MSATKVFNTVEILETILLQLPIRDVLLDQRVSRSWRAVIAGSISIQRALFLRPMKRSCNTRKSDICFVQLSTPGQQVLDCRDTMTLMTAILPIADGSRGTLQVDKPRFHADFCAMASCSWSNMLLTQPPRYEEIFFSNHVNQLLDPSENSIHMHLKDSMTLGDATVSQGELYDLGAFHIATNGRYITVTDVLRALEEEMKRHDRAMLAGDDFRFGWDGHTQFDGAATLWQDLLGVKIREF